MSIIAECLEQLAVMAANILFLGYIAALIVIIGSAS